jgi:lipopolysaccharide biosynthesis glycosyltransferase
MNEKRDAPSKALVTACNASYLVGAETLLRSVKKFHPDVKRYCIVPSSDLAIAQARLTSANLAEAVSMPRHLRGVPDRFQIAIARAFTPMFPEDVAAWIDCDAVMCRPSPELWRVPDGKVNAVCDTAYEIVNMVDPRLRVSFEKLFPEALHQRGLNTGFFSLHTAEWKDLPEKCERALVEGQFAFYPSIFDQPLLGALMLSKMNWLPFAFNAHHIFDYHIPRDVRVVHFTSNPKPWMPGYPKHEPGYYYWVRYGLEETRISRLMAVRWRILVRTPRRIVSRFLRQHFSGHFHGVSRQN